MSHVKSKPLYSTSIFPWEEVNTARVSSFCFNVLQNTAAFTVEGRSWLSSASSASLMIPSLSALIVASKTMFCFFTFWISCFILRFKSTLFTFFSSSNLYLWQDNRQLFLKAGVIWKTDSCEPPLRIASYTSLCGVKDFSCILCSITLQLMENPFSVKLWPCDNIKMILQMAHKLLYDSFSAKNGAKNTSRPSSLK